MSDTNPGQPPTRKQKTDDHKGDDFQEPGGPDPAEVAWGGAQVEVSYLAKKFGRDSKTETIKVKILNLDQALVLADIWGSSQVALIELVTGRDKDWVNTLTIESQDRVVEEGTRLNYPTLRGSLRRKRNIIRLLRKNPLMNEIVSITTLAMTEAIKALASSNSLSGQPANSASPAPPSCPSPSPGSRPSSPKTTTKPET